MAPVDPAALQVLAHPMTDKQIRILELWAAEYEKLGSDPHAAPNLPEEQRHFKLVFAQCVRAALAEIARLRAERDALQSTLLAVLISHDADQDLEFDEAMKRGRELTGLVLTPRCSAHDDHDCEICTPLPAGSAGESR